MIPGGPIYYNYIILTGDDQLKLCVVTHKCDCTGACSATLERITSFHSFQSSVTFLKRSDDVLLCNHVINLSCKLLTITGDPTVVSGKVNLILHTYS